MKQEDLSPKQKLEAQIRERIGPCSGFSLAKIVLSNALPSSLYYPDPDGDAQPGK